MNGSTYRQMHTLQAPVDLEGIGLHTGAPIRLRLKPAPVGTGVVFVRTDLPGRPVIPARSAQVTRTELATTLGLNDVTISTVEHLCAALGGLGVDNCVVEVSGPEIPILDGSALPFARAILSVGVIAQAASRPRLVLKRAVRVGDGDRWAVAEPCSRLEIHATVNWRHPMIGEQEFHYVGGRTDFMTEVAPARTFGFLRDVERMRAAGLARGGSLDNAVVLDETAVLNPEGLRFDDEFVRHKVLDAIGDFFLAGAGARLEAFVRLHRAGHELHHQLVTAIFADRANYDWRELPATPSRDEELADAAALGGLAAVANG